MSYAQVIAVQPSNKIAGNEMSGGQGLAGRKQGEGIVVVPNSKNWSTGLFQCEAETDCASLDEWLCWCCYACKLTNSLGQCCLYCPCLRTSTRLQYGIRGSACEDLCVFTLCGPCAINQLYRELSNMSSTPNLAQ